MWTQSLDAGLPPLPQVTCYHKGSRGTDRTLVFRVQFHTCTIHGPRLIFSKDQLDEAWAGELETSGLGAGARVKAGRWVRAGRGSPAPHCPLPTDERFPFQASVEFVFSSSPEKIKGKSQAWQGAGGRVVSLLLTPGAPFYR